jgi:hypothetical protein
MHIMSERFDRNIRLFGKEGQDKISASRLAVVGVGGLGTHVVQQAALLGVGRFGLIDSEELDETNLNRYVGARYDDPIPGTPKVDIGERIVESINADIEVTKVFDSLVSEDAFTEIIHADYVFGSLDSEGARLVLTELCAAYDRPYFDLASDISSLESLTYGGRVFVSWKGHGCLVCCGVLDIAEAQAELSGPEGKRNRDALYGVLPDLLDRVGPSVVSINCVIASLAVTEFMVAVTGIRAPKRLSTYYGHSGKVTVSSDEPAPDCYYCKGIRGKRDAVGVQDYIRKGVGVFLR